MIVLLSEHFGPALPVMRPSGACEPESGRESRDLSAASCGPVTFSCAGGIDAGPDVSGLDDRRAGGGKTGSAWDGKQDNGPPHKPDSNVNPGPRRKNWPAFLTTRRGEVGERAVRLRREPGGGKRRAQAYLNSTLSTASKRNEVLAVVSRASFLGHESRITAFMLFTKHETRLFFACFDRRVVRNAG